MQLPDSIDLSLLREAVRHSGTVTRDTMKTRVDIAREVAGYHYSSGGALRPVKVNLLAMYQQIVVNALIAKEPQFHLSSFDDTIARTLRAEEDDLNNHVKEIDLSDSLKRWVIDAFYPGGGWFKVAIASPCDAANEGWARQAGQAGAWPIDFEDMILDCGARRQSEMTFIGHWYLCPHDVALKMYGKLGKQLQPVNDQYRDFNEEGIEKIGRIFRGYYGIREFEDHVRLAEIYLPRHRLVVTLAEQDLLDKKGNPQPLWVQPWVGPDCGPFYCMGFKTIPGSPLPGSPLGDLFELHLDYNMAMRKIARQAARFKENTIGHQRDAEAIDVMRNAADGHVFALEMPDSIKTVPIGGSALPALVQIAEVFKSLFMLLGGNLELIGGRGPQSKTAHQDEMMNENAGAGLATLQQEVVTNISKVGSALYWFRHHHPTNVANAPYPIKGTPVTVQRKIYPANASILKKHGIDPRNPGDARIRDFQAEIAKVKCDPYSIQHQTPQQRLGFIKSVVADMTPLMPLLQQAGLHLDAQALMDIYSRYGDEPAIRQLFNMQEPPAPEGEAGGSELPHDQTLPAQTERTYTRRNIGQEQAGGTTQQASAAMMADAGGSPKTEFSMNGVH